MIKVVELRAVAKITMGQSPDGSTYNTEGIGVPLLNGPTEFGATHPLSTLFTTDSKRECKKGDLIFCVRGSTTGRMNWADQKYSLGRGVCSIEGKSFNETKYFRYCLELLLPSLLNLAGGSTFPNLNKDDIGKFKIPYPKSIDRIASILSAYDELIEVNNQRIKLLEETAKELYKEWFVRMRFWGYQKAKFVKGVPEGWEHIPIGNIIDYNIGGGWGNDKLDNQFTVPGYVIRGTDIPSIRSGVNNPDVYRYHKASNIKSRELQEGDIVFETAGGSEGQLLGRTCFITKEILEAYGDKVMCASFCKLIRTESIPSLYLYYFLNYLYDTGMIETFQTQSTGISNYQFEPFLKFQEILLPDKNLMKEFHSKALLIQKQIALLGTQNSQLRQIRDRLLPRLVSGKLSVKVPASYPENDMLTMAAEG